jgi:hypothetical protein
MLRWLIGGRSVKKIDSGEKEYVDEATLPLTFLSAIAEYI